MSVKRAQQEIDSVEFIEWLIHYKSLDKKDSNQLRDPKMIEKTLGAIYGSHQ